MGMHASEIHPLIGRRLLGGRPRIMTALDWMLEHRAALGLPTNFASVAVLRLTPLHLGSSRIANGEVGVDLTAANAW
jgi:hypothetical protein